MDKVRSRELGGGQGQGACCAIAVLAVALILCARPGLAQEQESEWEELTGSACPVSAAWIDPGDGRHLFISRESALLRSLDGGKTWEEVLNAGGRVQVRCIEAGPEGYYAGTSAGLYLSRDGQGWRRVFRRSNSAENDCLCIGFCGADIYLGTGAGLWVSRDRGRSWQKEPGVFAGEPVRGIAVGKRADGHIFVSSGSVLQRRQKGSPAWQKVFSHTDPTEAAEEVVSAQAITEPSEPQRHIRALCLDERSSGRLYVGTEDGVLVSEDSGTAWQRLPDEGLLRRAVTGLAVSGEGKLFCATPSGIFSFGPYRWKERSLRLPVTDVRAVYCARDGLYAATADGFFRAHPAPEERVAEGEALDPEALVSGDPDIAAVQHAAVDYAQVSPERIADWQRRMRRRAFFPQLSVGFDYDNDRTNNSNIWGSYGSATTSGKYYAGPDTQTKYDQRNWDVSLSWDLADIVWSDAETSIDTRARLMVELRNELLDEVTKLYFERLRLKAELAGDERLSSRKRAEKTLRLAELAAQLDGLTGDFFSRQSVHPVPGISKK